jgi:hypothetical protein
VEKGIEPRRRYSGKFNIRIPPELHERLAMLAQAEGKSVKHVSAGSTAKGCRVRTALWGIYLRLHPYQTRRVYEDDNGD